MRTSFEPPSEGAFDPLQGGIHLRAAEHRFLLEMIRSAAVVVEDNVIRYVNSDFGALVDRPARELVGISLDTLLHESSRAAVAAWMIEPRRDGEAPLRIDLRLLSRDPQRGWANARCVKGTWDGREAAFFFLADMAELRRGREVEEQLRQAQKMEAVGRLAGGVAHDMNNVLGAIMGFASVLHAEMDPASRMRDDVAHILAACRKGRDLMLNLLGFARKGKYRIELFTLNERVEDAVRLLRRTIPKKIRIEVDLSKSGAQIHGDPTQIHHALMNVCLNAVDAMGEVGTLGIFTDTVNITEDDRSIHPELEAGLYSRVRVSDTGRGMDREVMNMAFEPFFTTKPIGQGSGLGLPMVYGTVRNHGGAVVLESKPGEGTVVTLLLPQTKTPSSAMRSLSESRPPSDPAGITVLLVDDESMVREAGKRLLEKLGYRVLLAANGRDAMRVFAQRKDTIGAVMLDLMMPVMDGEETLAGLKEIGPGVPVLLCSGFSKEEKAEGLLERGASGFIQKPFDLKTLRARMTEILSE